MTGARSWDVAIAGGGPAGSIAALVLARAGRRVLLADASNGESRIGEALPPAALPLLRDLQLLPAVTAAHSACPANASAWGSADLHVSDFIFNAYGNGFHLDRAQFDASLRNTAADAGAEVVTGARLEARGEVRLRVNGREEPVECRWVVDASGRAATTAIARGATRTTEDGLVAFYARFVHGQGALDRDNRTLVESCADGWWYTALLPSRERLVAFLTDKDLASRQQLLSPEGLMAGIARTKHVREAIRSSAYTMTGRPRGADAATSRLDRVTGADWVAAGDAALAFDPLSSQGIFNAMYTGMQAGRALDAALEGDDEALPAYAARVDQIHRAYRRNLAAFYALEQRWSDHPFWCRRLPV